MLSIVLALAAAVSFSVSDYLAGLAARAADVVTVTAVDQVVFAIVLLFVVPFVSSDGPSVAGLAWGAAAGIGGAAGAMALYLGFRQAAFSVASSVSAVGSAAFSVLAGLLLGERPGSLSLAGIALALLAIAAVSASAARASNGEPEPARRPGSYGLRPPRRHRAAGPHASGIMPGLAAGAGFGLFYICLNRAGSAASLWPLAAAAVAGTVLVLGIAMATGRLRLSPAGTRTLSVMAGVTAAAGTVSYFLATHTGLLAVTAAIASLHPAGTIVLARLLMDERLTTTRIVGLCLAVTAIGLITAARTTG